MLNKVLRNTKTICSAQPLPTDLHILKEVCSKKSLKSASSHVFNPMTDDQTDILTMICLNQMTSL